MKALKQHLFWVVAGIVLLAEVVFAFTVVASRFGESEQLKSKVEGSKSSLQKTISGAKQGKLANEATIGAARQRQIAVGRSYMEFLLFMMERDSKLERIEPAPRDGYFDDLEIAERGRCQQRYDRLTLNLRQSIRKAGMALPNDTAIAQAEWREGVPSYDQLLDAFKVLWLQKACVDAMTPEGSGPLVSIVNQFGFGKGGSAGMGDKVQYLLSAGEDAQYRRALFFLDVSMPFTNLPAFVSHLLSSECIIELRGCRILKSDPVGGKGSEPAGPQSVGLVRVEMALEAVDFDLDIHKITFSGEEFASQNDVVAWVGRLRQDSPMDSESTDFLLGRLAGRPPVKEKEDFEVTLRPFRQFLPSSNGKLVNGKQLEIDKGVTVHLGLVLRSQ